MLFVSSRDRPHLQSNYTIFKPLILNSTLATANKRGYSSIRLCHWAPEVPKRLLSGCGASFFANSST